MLIIGLLGVLIGMIIESAFEKANIEEPEQIPDQQITIIEINDKPKEPVNDLFKPF